jgi:D-alanyl-D-alanine carboxypeptidase
MKASQNLYAETLVKAIGSARGGLGTFEGGLSAPSPRTCRAMVR